VGESGGQREGVIPLRLWGNCCKVLLKKSSSHNTVDNVDGGGLGQVRGLDNTTISQFPLMMSQRIFNS
jgi:hypothetical protein